MHTFHILKRLARKIGGQKTITISLPVCGRQAIDYAISVPTTRILISGNFQRCAAHPFFLTIFERITRPKTSLFASCLQQAIPSYPWHAMQLLQVSILLNMYMATHLRRDIKVLRKFQLAADPSQRVFKNAMRYPAAS